LQSIQSISACNLRKGCSAGALIEAIRGGDAGSFAAILTASDEPGVQAILQGMAGIIINALHGKQMDAAPAPFESLFERANRLLLPSLPSSREKGFAR
jgi:hypothetical protein